MSPAYTRVQIILHWVVLLLVAFNFLSGDAMGELYRNALKAGTVGGPTPHAIAGVLVLVLTVIRMVIKKRRGGAPAPVDGATPLQHKLASIGHLALYALLILAPVSGMLTWGVGIAAMADPHEVIVKLMMLVVAGHGVMALYHHYIVKDNTLRRMVRPH